MSYTPIFVSRILLEVLMFQEPDNSVERLRWTYENKTLESNKSLCTTSASEARRYLVRSLSYWSHKTLESNKSAPRSWPIPQPGVPKGRGRSATHRGCAWRSTTNALIKR